jgi:hypothetical protein
MINLSFKEIAWITGIYIGVGLPIIYLIGKKGQQLDEKKKRKYGFFILAPILVPIFVEIYATIFVFMYVGVLSYIVGNKHEDLIGILTIVAFITAIVFGVMTYIALYRLYKKAYIDSDK